MLYHLTIRIRTRVVMHRLIQTELSPWEAFRYKVTPHNKCWGSRLLRTENPKRSRMVKSYQEEKALLLLKTLISIRNSIGTIPQTRKHCVKRCLKYLKGCLSVTDQTNLWLARWSEKSYRSTASITTVIRTISVSLRESRKSKGSTGSSYLRSFSQPLLPRKWTHTLRM